jgi:membrane peptidoglycan carboxypeptidase
VETPASSWSGWRPEGGRPGRLVPWRRRVRALLAVLVASVLLVVLIMAAVVAAAPTVDDAPARVDALLAQHGGHYVRLGRDARLSRALVAVEDHRFFEHQGVDPLAFARVGLRALTRPGSDAAGSTISLQLAKMLYTGTSSDLGAALTQLGVALRLERTYAKDELLDLYLNAAYYGDGEYGAERASSHYAGRAADALTWGEASMLAGMVQAPSRYSRDLTAARNRQKHVLDRLVATGALTRVEADTAYSEPLRRFRELAGAGAQRPAPGR